MLSQGTKIGFEAYLTHPGQESEKRRFNEHQVKHYVNESGDPITECWLECEDDATFEINVVKTDAATRKVLNSDWRCRVYVDGQQLGASAWTQAHDRHRIWAKVYQHDAQSAHMERAGPLQFQRPVIIQGVAPDAGNEQSRERTIRITLERGTMVRSSRKEPDKSWQAPEPIPETKAKLASTIGSQLGKARPSRVLNHYSFRPSKKGIWQTFVFKYRNRTALEVQKIIAVEPPAPAENEDSDDEKGEDDFELLDDNKAGDMKPRILNGTQRQARRIRRLEAELRAERARNEPAKKRSKVIDLSLSDD